MVEIPNSEQTIPCELVLIAAGFLHPEKEGILNQLGITLDEKGNVKTEDNMDTNKKGIFAAGDMRMGQSLVVWAIAEGRKVAEKVHAFVQTN